MFYSHTFLAQKGPLGTVWCAAHQQKMLKKSHYASTDITSAVERIMFPEVPIALRMSGHLLLGVVRIYSMKVRDLHEDYEYFQKSLLNAFPLRKFDLPEGDTQASFNSITLPYTFLNAMDLDNEFCYEGNQDKHLKSFDEITLSCDQIPTGRDPYIIINFDKHILRSSSSLGNVSGSGARLMEEEDSFSETVENTHRSGCRNPIDGDFPETEFPRENNTMWLGPQNDVLPPDTFIEDQIVKDKAHLTFVIEETLFRKEVLISPQKFHRVVDSPVSKNAEDDVFSNNSPGHKSPNLEMRPSPPVEEPDRRPRKRKQRSKFLLPANLIFKVMRAALNNCDDIKRTRKRPSTSDLYFRKSNSKLKVERIFSEPLIAGLSEKLRSIHAEKLHLLSDPMNNHYEEIECRRNYEGPLDNSVIPDGIYDNRLSSRKEREEFTHVAGSSIGSPQTGTTSETISDLETPFAWVKDTGLSPIPEDMGSAQLDDINFLASDYAPTNFNGTEGYSSLSGATRKVAQYLKENYSPISEDLNSVLSLNQLLEGKTRKVCARMLFETMVLKCGGLVDLQQEEAYADIKLKLTHKLFKG